MVTITFCLYVGHSFRLETVLIHSKEISDNVERKTQHQVHQYTNLCSEEDGCLRVKRLKGSEDMIFKKNFLAAGLTSLDGKVQTEVRLKDTPDFFFQDFLFSSSFFSRAQILWVPFVTPRLSYLKH